MEEVSNQSLPEARIEHTPKGFEMEALTNIEIRMDPSIRVHFRTRHFVDQETAPKGFRHCLPSCFVAVGRAQNINELRPRAAVGNPEYSICLSVPRYVPFTYTLT